MTTEEINIMFPASYGGNAQISDLRLALSRLVNEGNVGGGDSELEKIDEGNGPGWRILGRDPTRYANIGEGAIDLSYSGTHGSDNGASGKYSFVEGFRTSAAGLYSHAGGYNTSAPGRASHTEGDRTYAPGSYSHAEGDRTIATGEGSHAEGSMTSTNGNRAHAEGSGSRANGNDSHAEGSNTIATGIYSHTEGYSSHAEGESSHAEGRRTIALNQASHAAGKYNVGTATDTIHETGIGVANNSRANAFEIYTDGRIRAPELTIALHDDDSSLATKEYVDANAGGGGGLEQVTEGGNTGWRLIGMDPDSYADTGDRAVDFSVSNSSGATTHGATNYYSFACGLNTVSDGTASHAEGQDTRALGDASHAEGDHCTAEGYASHAEGGETTSTGDYSHTEGYYTTATEYTSHAEGYATEAEGGSSHAEGYYSTAEGDASHAEGYETDAIGTASHAEGYNTRAEGNSAHAEGYNTLAGNDYMHAAGKYNTSASGDTIHETGIGADHNNRANAFEIYTDGTLTAPECTNTLIVTRGDKALVTKEYVDANAGGGGGLVYDETDGTHYGWAPQCRFDNPDRYGDIGQGAVDLSASDGTSDYGASGKFSFATGYLVRATEMESFVAGHRNDSTGDASASFGSYCGSSGSNSFTCGRGADASGSSSMAINYNCEAIGNNSFASGVYTIALNYASSVAGIYNVGTATDTIHETGIGADDANKANAFEIYTDGTLTMPEATPTLIEARGGKAIPTLEWLLSPEFGSSLPTTDPSVPGTLWSNSGIVTVS